MNLFARLRCLANYNDAHRAVIDYQGDFDMAGLVEMLDTGAP